MLIKTVKIEGYRSLKNVEADLNNYTTIVGENGVGKSSFLYALDRFFNHDKPLPEDEWLSTDTEEVSIEITFIPSTQNDLGDGEPRWYYSFPHLFIGMSGYEIEKLIEGGNKEDISFEEKLVLRKVWDRKGRVKTPIFYIKTYLPEIAKEDWVKLEKGSKGPFIMDSGEDTIPYSSPVTGEYNLETLNRWHSYHNFSKLDDATPEYMFYKLPLKEAEKITSLINYILLPAITNYAETLAQKGKNITPVQDLLEKIYKSSIPIDQRTVWEGTLISLKKQQTHMTKEAHILMSQLIKNTFPQDNLILKEPIVPEWEPSFPQWELTAYANTEEKQPIPLHLQGHGKARSLLISFLKNPLKRKDVTTIFALEEPEVHQHPIKIRTLAAELQNWAATSDFSQAIVVTHSPYFLGKNFLNTTIRFELLEGYTRASKSILKNEDTKITKMFLRAPEFKEVFFASKVILTEGPSDEAVLLALDNIFNQRLSNQGIIIIACESKSAMLTPKRLINSIGMIPFLIFDIDKKNKTGASANTEELLGYPIMMEDTTETIYEKNFIAFLKNLEYFFKDDLGFLDYPMNNKQVTVVNEWMYSHQDELKIHPGIEKLLVTIERSLDNLLHR